MTGLDQPEKGSRRAYVFRNAIDNRRKRAAPALTLSANSKPIFNHFDPTVLLLLVAELSVRTVWRHNTACRVMETMLRHLNARAFDPSILGLARPALR